MWSVPSLFSRGKKTFKQLSLNKKLQREGYNVHFWIGKDSHCEVLWYDKACTFCQVKELILYMQCVDIL